MTTANLKDTEIKAPWREDAGPNCTGEVQEFVEVAIELQSYLRLCTPLPGELGVALKAAEAIAEELRQVMAYERGAGRPGT